MTDCRNIEADLSALVDGELTVGRRTEVETHLAGCALCRARVAALRELAAGLAAMPKAQPAPEFLAGVRQRMLEGKGPRVERPEKSVWHSPWVLWPVRLAAATAVFVGVAVLLTPAYKALLRATGHATIAKAQPPAESAPALQLAEKQAEAKTADRIQPAGQPAAAPAAPVAANKRAEPAPPPIASIAAANSAAMDADRAVPAPAEMAEARRAVVPLERAKAAPVVSQLNRDVSGAIIVESADADRVRTNATQLAVALGGRLVSAADERSDRFQVAIPAQNVETFRRRLLRPEMEKDRGALGFTDGLATNEPVSVLEIRVVAPAK